MPQAFFFFFFPPAGPKRPHMVLNRRVINKLICVQRPKIWKATNSAHSSSTASGLQSRSVQDDSFFSPRSGWRAPHTTFNRKAAFFFFSRCFFHSFPPPLYFFVRLPATRRPFSFPASTEEQGPKFRVVVCRSRAFGIAPPLRFSQVVWMFSPPQWFPPEWFPPSSPPSQAFLDLLLFGLWSCSEMVCYHEGYRHDSIYEENTILESCYKWNCAQSATQSCLLFK